MIKELSYIYTLVELGEKRKASVEIFGLFDSLLESNGDIEELLDMVDVSKLTSFEIKTFAVASRPIARKTDSYKRLIERFNEYILMNCYNKDLLNGF